MPMQPPNCRHRMAVLHKIIRMFCKEDLLVWVAHKSYMLRQALSHHDNDNNNNNNNNNFIYNFKIIIIIIVIIIIMIIIIIIIIIIQGAHSPWRFSVGPYIYIKIVHTPHPKHMHKNNLPYLKHQPVPTKKYHVPSQLQEM